MFLRNLLILIVFLFLFGCGEPKLPSPFHAAEVGAKFTGADFKLTDHHGVPRTLADFRGKVVVLFFGYVHCPDVCPTTMADLAQVMAKLGRDADRVQVLFVTVDPERDTRELLSQYIPAFSPAFLGLAGDKAATEAAARAFEVVYQKQPSKTGYNMDHSSGAFVIDQKGRVRLLAPFAQQPAWMEQDIRLLLALEGK